MPKSIEMRISLRYILFLIITIISFFPTAQAGENSLKPFTVVVDPGHGGKDIGATDNGAKEKDINLGVALELEKLIKKKLKEAKVVMTRDNDTYLTLQERADVANKAKGDLFISIHTNSVDKSNKNRKTVSGASVYALGLHKDENNMKVARRENSVIELEQNFEQKYSGFDPSRDESYIIFEMAQKKNLSKSIKFAELAQKELVKSGRVNRGVHQAGFWVLWATSMPAVLIELDFICNPKHAAYLNSEKGHKELAEAIFNAVETYYEDWERMRKGAHEAVAKVVASSKKSTEKMEQGPATKDDGKRKTATKRRRRSESARNQSASRDVETDAIPLHTTTERMGRVVEEETITLSDLISDTPQLDEKAKKKALKEQAKREKKERERLEKERKAKEKAEKRKSKASHNAKVSKFVTVYKIQILASADLLKQNNPRFCGLAPITTYKENNLYKYYYGESQDKREIEEMLKDVKKKIPDAFIVSSMKSENKK